MDGPLPPANLHVASRQMHGHNTIFSRMMSRFLRSFIYASRLLNFSTDDDRSSNWMLLHRTLFLSSSKICRVLVVADIKMRDSNSIEVDSGKLMFQSENHYIWLRDIRHACMSLRCCNQPIMNYSCWKRWEKMVHLWKKKLTRVRFTMSRPWCK